MRCYCFARNITDRLWNDLTPYEMRFGSSPEGPLIPFGAFCEFLPDGPEDRVPAFGKKTRPGIFMGYHLYVGEIWKGEYHIFDAEDFTEAASISLLTQQLKRVHFEQVYVPKEGGCFIFPIANGDYNQPPGVDTKPVRSIGKIFRCL